MYQIDMDFGHDPDPPQKGGYSQFPEISELQEYESGEMPELVDDAGSALAWYVAGCLIHERHPKEDTIYKLAKCCDDYGEAKSAIGRAVTICSEYLNQNRRGYSLSRTEQENWERRVYQVYKPTIKKFIHRYRQELQECAVDKPFSLEPSAE